MSKELHKILDLLISEDKEAASAALNEWFTEQNKGVLASILAESADEEVEECDESEDLDESITITIDDDSEDDVTVSEADDEVDADVADDAAEFAADDVADGDMDADDFGGEEIDEPIEDRVEELQATLDELRAQFEELMGSEADEEGEEEFGADDETVEDGEGEDEVDEDIAPGVPGKPRTFSQKGGINVHGNQAIKEDDELEESDDLAEYDDLAESADHKLEPVKAEKLKTEGETTGKGEKVKVDTKSPVPERSGAARVGGEPVKIKGKTAKGYALETAPKVEGGKEKFKNSQKEPKKISKEGDKSAELNKGKEDKSAKSPIGGGATNLRGDDFKR